MSEISELLERKEQLEHEITILEQDLDQLRYDLAKVKEQAYRRIEEKINVILTAEQD